MECVCGQKCQFNKKVKEALLIEDTALVCWVCDDVPDEDSERNNEVEGKPDNDIFDPNEQQEEADELEESQNVNLQDLVPNAVFSLEFWSAVNAEIERILDRNSLIMVDARAGNDQKHEDDDE